ncbi:MAG: hypothetical protein ABR953_13990 [Candidatus Acidiferrales bacterium]|jgi:hypothetical protein
MIRGWRKESGQAGSNPKERRGVLRYPLKAAAYVVDAQSNARVISRASDLNLGGCRIDAVICFPAGSAVWLRLTKADLAFVSTEPEQLWVAKKWVDEIRREERPAEPVASRSKMA